jgi:hypothetical protein
VIAADQADFYADATGDDPAGHWRETRRRREESYLAEARGDDERDAADRTPPRDVRVFSSDAWRRRGGGSEGAGR